MKVRALKLGIWNGSRVRPGAVFEVPDDTKLGMWMARVDAPAAVAKPAPAPAPAAKGPTKAGNQSVI